MQQRERLIQRGQDALDEGRFSTAVASLREALTMDSDDTEVRLLLAEALAEDGKIQAALKVLEDTPAEAITPELWIVHGDLMLEEGQQERARQSYEKALALDPESEDGWVSLGLADSAVERFDEALRAYSRALQINPQSVFALTAQGDAYCLAGRYDEAIRSYRLALSLDPDDAQAHHSLGDLLYDQGKQKEAEQSYLAARAIDPEFEQVYLSLGNLYMGQDMTKAAIEAFETFLRLETGPSAKEIREEVKAVLDGLKNG